MGHYVNQSGIYLGEYEDGSEPDGAILVHHAPEDATDQYWANSQWTWRVHYYRDAGGNFIGACAGPDKPEGAIEVDEPPAYGTQKWVDGAWSEPVTE